MNKYLLILILIFSLNVPTVESQTLFTDTWYYTDGVETNSTFFIINQANNTYNYSMSLYSENFWTLYTQEGMYAGSYYNYTGMPSYSQYTYLEGLKYVEPYTITDYNNVSVTLRNLKRKYKQDYNISADITRIDKANFIGFGSYTFENNQTVSTIDIEYIEDYSTYNGTVMEIIDGTNTTTIYENGIGTSYVNGSYDRDITFNYTVNYIYQFSPAVYRVVNVTRNLANEKGLSLDVIKERQMLSFDINNFIDWKPPTENTPTTSITPTTSTSPEASPTETFTSTTNETPLSMIFMIAVPFIYFIIYKYLKY